MIDIFKNKHLKITICLILIFTISINFMFYQKVQAVGITSGLALKAMAVILSSMGVLHVVQNNGGIQSFFDSFTLFNHEGLNALRDMAINNIVHNVKIKANNVIASIRDFFNSWAQEEFRDPFAIPENTYFSEIYFTDAKVKWSQGTVIEEFTFDNNVKIMLGVGSYNALRYQLYYNDSLEASKVIPISNFTSSTQLSNKDIRVKSQFNFTSEGLLINLQVHQFNDNISGYGSDILSTGIFDLIYQDFDYMPLDPIYDIPQPQSLPRNGVDIAWDEATNKSISYLPGETKLEKLIEDIANASVETFVEKYTSWGKATTDSLTGPIISTETRVNQETGVEEQVITDVTETVFDDIYEETQTQTGLLGSILGAITDLKDFIKSIFIPEEFNALDFSPLQNIGIADKFPFSLPWDLKNSVLALTANPEAPIFDVPIVSEVITLDFSEFESWASIIRVFITLIFVIGLIILTRRLI